MKLGVHLSTEEFKGSDIVQLAKRAEEAGFSFATISDHFHPWTSTQGQSPFAWSIIGAISQVTKKIEIITGVTCPIMRYHPAIIAQAAATCGELLEGRFTLGLGTGEDLNEHVIGQQWPPIQIRQEMLREAIEVIHELWRGKATDFFGDYFLVIDAKIYTLPKKLPRIFVAAGGKHSTQMAGEVADGFISVIPNKELISIFETSGGDKKPKIGQTAVCYDADEKKALAIAHKLWPVKGLQGTLSQDLRTTELFEAASATVRPEDILQKVAVGPDKETHLKEIKKFTDAGFDHVSIAQIGPHQEEFFSFYEKEILPEFR